MADILCSTSQRNEDNLSLDKSSASMFRDPAVCVAIILKENLENKTA